MHNITFWRAHQNNARKCVFRGYGLRLNADGKIFSIK